MNEQPEKVQELEVDYWQFDYALARLRTWEATAVAFYRNEIGGYTKVQKEGRVWKHYGNHVVTQEQYNAVRSKASYVLAYTTPTTAGTLVLLILPNVESLQGTRDLTAKVREEIESALRNKR